MTADHNSGEVYARLNALEGRVSDMRDEMRSGFNSVNERLDKVPTSDLMLVHLAGWEKQLQNVTQMIQRVDADLQKEIRRVEQKADARIDTAKREQSQSEKRVTDARRWAIGAAIGAASVLVAFVGVMVQLGGLL